MAYHTRANIEGRYGPANVAKWADLDCDANATKITNRINEAIAYSDSLIDDYLRASVYNYSLPLSPVPLTITACAVKISGYWLSTARGLKQFDKDGNPITPYYADYRSAIEILDAIREQRIRIAN
jgi:phage gp36-like protein